MNIQYGVYLNKPLIEVPFDTLQPANAQETQRNVCKTNKCLVYVPNSAFYNK